MAEKTLGERAIILTAGRFAAVIVGIMTPIVFVRVFSQTEFGAYRQINLAIITVIGILTFGFPQSLFYFFPKYPAKRRTFVSQALYSQIVLGIIFVIFTMFSGEWLAKFFKHDIFRIASPLIGLTALFQLIRTFLEALLIVEKRVSWASLYIVGHDIFRGLSLVLVALVSRSLLAIVYTLMIYEFIGFAFVVIYTAVRYGVFRFPISRESYMEQGQYAFPMGFARTVAGLTQQLDHFLIVGYYNPAGFALFSQGAFPLRFFRIPHRSIFDIAIPQVVTLVTEERRQELIRLWRDLVFKLGVITIPVVVLSQIVGTDAMVFLFTEQYRFSGHLFQLYVLVMLKYVTAFAVLPRSYARTGLILKSNIASLATMVALGLPGTIYFGMWGTVVAMLISQYVHAYIQMWQGRRDIDLPWKEYLPWKQLFQVTGITILAGIPPAIMMLIIPTVLGRLAVNIPLYVICYLGLLHLTGVYKWVQDPIILRLVHRYLPFLGSKKNENF